MPHACRLRPPATRRKEPSRACGDLRELAGENSTGSQRCLYDMLSSAAASITLRRAYWPSLMQAGRRRCAPPRRGAGGRRGGALRSLAGKDVTRSRRRCLLDHTRSTTPSSRSLDLDHARAAACLTRRARRRLRQLARPRSRAGRLFGRAGWRTTRRSARGGFVCGPELARTRRCGNLACPHEQRSSASTVICRACRGASRPPTPVQHCSGVLGRAAAAPRRAAPVACAAAGPTRSALLLPVLQVRCRLQLTVTALLQPAAAAGRLLLQLLLLLLLPVLQVRCSSL
jgi:hypothetical protein